MAHTTGAANAWSVIAADSARDMVFVPTGSASPDYYGGERVGDNRYANSVVALRASTGKVVWSFQAVHHDLWDYDVASPPALVTIMHDGRMRAVVLQATKSGQLFVLDRDTGAPVFPVEERAVPASTIAGEHASPTQPFNTVIPALSPQSLSLDSVWGPTPADRESCLAQIRPLRNEGVFTPPSEQGTLAIPSNIGGAHWGGVAYDPAHQLAIVPVNRIPAFVQLIPLDQQDTAEIARNESRLGDQYTRMHGTPYIMRRRMITSPSRAPCTPPPWGALVAINLATGARAWEVPLGDPSAVAPGLSKARRTDRPFGNAKPRRTYRNGRWSGVYRRDDGSRAPCVRCRNGTGTMEGKAAGRRTCHADDLSTDPGRQAIRRSIGGWKRGMGGRRLRRGVHASPSSKIGRHSLPVTDNRSVRAVARELSGFGRCRQVLHVHVEVFVDADRRVRSGKPHGLPGFRWPDPREVSTVNGDAQRHVEPGHHVRPVI